MTFQSKFFWIANFVLALVFVSVVAFAWNNPTENPPDGTGSISTDGANNVSIVGQVGLGVVPEAATRLGILATATYRWPLFITTNDGTVRRGGISFPPAPTSMFVGTESAHSLDLATGDGAGNAVSRMTIDTSGKIGMGVAPTATARLSLLDPAFVAFPPASATIVRLGSSNGLASGSSIRALGSVYAGGVILTESAFSSKLADVAEYVRVEGGSSQYAQGDILTIAPVEDSFKKPETAYDKKLAGVVSTTGGVLLGSEGVEKNEKGEPQDHVQLALAGRVPVKVTGENGPIAIGDAITSSSIPGVGMKAIKSGRVVGFALQSFNGEGVGYVKILINPHYWIAE